MKARIITPNNIFSKIFISEINLSDDYQIELQPASLISQKLVEDNNAIGLIPTMDLLSSKELFVSSEIGISFNALLSNSYIYFRNEQETIEEIFLAGDVSSNEIILSKILFKEFYDLDVKPTLAKNIEAHEKDNLLIVGDENYKKDHFLKGLSFSEEVIELISAPYVNFALAGSSEKQIKEFTAKYKADFKNGHAEDFQELLKGLTATSLDFISTNIQHIIFDFEDQDLEGIKSLLQMPYYHGIIKNLIEVKLV